MGCVHGSLGCHGELSSLTPAFHVPILFCSYGCGKREGILWDNWGETWKGLMGQMHIPDHCRGRSPHSLLLASGVCQLRAISTCIRTIGHVIHAYHDQNGYIINFFSFSQLSCGFHFTILSRFCKNILPRVLWWERSDFRCWIEWRIDFSDRSHMLLHAFAKVLLGESGLLQEWWQLYYYKE